MIFNLFPQRPDHPLADDKEFKRILAELLIDRPMKAVDEVVGWFESLKHAENFRLDHYFGIIRQLDDVAQQHLRRMTRDYLQPDGASRFEQDRLWARSYGYWGELAAILASCLERAQRDPKTRGADLFKNSLQLATVRLQAALGNRILWLAYRYGPVDQALWRDLGKTYLAAEAGAYAEKLLQPYAAQRGLTSVAQQYLHALVFYTSSMDSLLPQQIALADRLVAHFLPGFVFSRNCRADSVHWVDAATDAAPSRLLRRPGAASDGLRFFSPGAALPALEQMISVVERGELPADLNIGGDCSPRVLLPVLRHLRTYWALRPPQRRHQRHVVQTRMAVMLGFDHSYTVFSGVAAHLDRGAAVQHWVVENVSLGGFRACFEDSGDLRIKLGSLLCMQAEGGDNWLLGTARRFNRLPDGHASLGVQVLSRQAQSVELRPRRSGFSAAIATPGIWLCDGGEPGLVRMVLPPGGFNVRETLDFRQDGRSHVLTAVELEETGVDYEIARFHQQSVR